MSHHLVLPPLPDCCAMSASHTCCSLPPLGPVRVSPEPRGSLNNLVPVPVEGVDAPPPGCLSLAVKAVGLNFRRVRTDWVEMAGMPAAACLFRASLFHAHAEKLGAACRCHRDVLNVLGMYPGEAGPPGGDVEGIVTAVGSGVDVDRLLGQLVFGQAAGCLGTAVVTSRHTGGGVIAASYTRCTRTEDMSLLCFTDHCVKLLAAVVPAPPNLSPEAAATVPTVFLTADACLNGATVVKPEHRVLIQAGGGVPGAWVGFYDRRRCGGARHRTQGRKP